MKRLACILIIAMLFLPACGGIDSINKEAPTVTISTQPEASAPPLASEPVLEQSTTVENADVHVDDIATQPPVLTKDAPPLDTPTQMASESASDLILKKLFDEKQSDVAVSGTGTVQRILADDVTSDKHQRFILELSSGQTLLVVHNIDIAPRVAPLEIGGTVEFRGEYVWNEQGGLIHWTHHDPDGSHTAGFIKANGEIYQ